MTKELPTSSSRDSNVNRSSSRAIFFDKTDNTTRGGEAEWDELRFRRKFAGKKILSSNSTSRDAQFWSLRHSSSLEHTMTALPKPHNKHMSKGKATDEPFTKQRCEMDSSFHCNSSVINIMPSGRHFARTWLAVMPPGWTPSTPTPPATSIFQEPPPSKNNLFYTQAHVLRQILIASACGRGGDNQFAAYTSRPVTMNCATTKPPSLSLHHSSSQPDLQAPNDSTSMFAGDEKEQLCTKLRTVKRIRSSRAIKCGLREFPTRLRW